MKKYSFKLLFIFFILFLFSCNKKSKSKLVVSTKKELHNNQLNYIDSVFYTHSLDSMNLNFNKFIKPIDDFKIRIFFKCLDENILREDKFFQKNKSVKYCYDIEKFGKIILYGKHKSLLVEFYDIKFDFNKRTYKINNLLYSKLYRNMNGKIVFTNKLFLLESATPYILIIRENNKIVFIGEIDSDACAC